MNEQDQNHTTNDHHQQHQQHQHQQSHNQAQRRHITPHTPPQQVTHCEDPRCLLALLVVGRVLRCFVCVCVASHFWRLQTTLLHVAPLSHFPDFLRWVGSKWLICWCRCRLARCTNCRKLFESPVHVQLSIVSSQQFFFFFFPFFSLSLRTSKRHWTADLTLALLSLV